MFEFWQIRKCKLRIEELPWIKQRKDSQLVGEMQFQMRPGVVSSNAEFVSKPEVVKVNNGKNFWEPRSKGSRLVQFVIVALMLETQI